MKSSAWSYGQADCLYSPNILDSWTVAHNWVTAKASGIIVSERAEKNGKSENKLKGKNLTNW